MISNPFESELDYGKFKDLERNVGNLIEDSHTKVGNKEWFDRASGLIKDIRQAQENLMAGTINQDLTYDKLAARYRILVESADASIIGL